MQQYDISRPDPQCVILILSMKILFLTHTPPYPPDDGMRSTCYSLIKEMSGRHEVSLMTLVESDKEATEVQLIRPWLKNFLVVRHAVPRSPLRRLWNMLVERDPFCVNQFYNPAYARSLQDLLARVKFDLVHFTSINVAGYHHCLGAVPGLFFPHDSVSMQFYRNAEREPNPLKKIYIYSQFRKTRRFEKTMIPKFAKTVVVSEVDRKWISEFLPGIDIPVIPGGVDPERFQPRQAPEEFPSVIFRGVMNFIPNVDAVLYFYNEIMPLILKEFPNLKFYVVGKNPTPDILDLNGKNTVVTGLVHDIRSYMAIATVNVCPMRSGSGMKNKILEAWAMEKPVVATRMATDGIALEEGKEILIADDAPTFAKHVIELLKNPQLRSELGKRGREKAIQKYTWSYVATLFEKVYEEMIAR